MKCLTDRFQLVSSQDPAGRSFVALVAADLRAKSLWYYGEANCRLAFRCFFSDGSLCTVLYRLMRAFVECRLSLLAAFIYKLNVFLTGAVIGRGARFGPGLVILHSQGLVINSAVKGGANVVLENGVTIGAEKGYSPRLGSRVFAGAGAKIIGNVCVGNDVRVGANAVVVSDLPDRTTAVGVPARIVANRGEGP